MNQFYVSMIFIGIILVLISLIWIAYDRNKGNNYEKRLEEKKEQLVGIISDAEQMIDELNRFSDYIVTQVDTKKDELLYNLQHLDELKNELKSSVQQTREETAAEDEGLQDAAGHAPAASAQSSAAVVKALPKHKNQDNVINKRNYEVLRLASRGLSETEIARTLNIGKGETELILQLNKQVIG